MKSFKTGLIVIILGLTISSCSKQDHPPNIIIILTDDQGWGDIASHGNPDIDTPNLDELAKAGARFDRFFVSPVCAPTRASLLTGRDHLRTGTQWVTYGLENMNASEVTFGEVFKEAGYQTGLFGKWHNGSHYPMDPNGQGFDTFFGFKQGHWNNYFDTQLEYNREWVKTEGFITDVLTDSALAFIEKNQSTPFLAFIPYNAPHSPFQVPDQYFNKYKAQGLDDKNASVYGMVENIDDNVGRIVERLDRLNLAENTIVIFMTDNGPNGGDRFNGNMKGWKAKVDEGGVRVPFFMKWPAKIKPGTVVEELTAHIDFLPSITDLAGIDFEPVNEIDGRSFASLLFDDSAPWSDRFLFTHQSRWDSLEMYPASVRNNQYRLVRYGESWELYDLTNDSTQSTDVSGVYPEVVNEMSAAYDKWFAEVTRQLPTSRPIPVGYEEASTAYLPAVESLFSGEIRFYGESGWSNDWLTNWSSESDKIWWNLDVVKQGQFTVLVEYSLSAGNEGVLLSASSGSEMIQTTINRIHDPEFVLSPDRVIRGEVYEKEWAVFEVGSLQLQEGSQTLTISSPEIPGQEGIELKGIILEKLN